MADKVVITYETEYNGDGAKQAQKDLTKTADNAKKTGEASKKAGEAGKTGFEGMAAGIGKTVAAFAAIKGVIDFFSSSISLANENARAVNTLAAAYNAVGYTAQGAMKQAQDFATKMQNLTGIADEAFLNAQRLLANYGVVGVKAQEAVQAAYALSIGRSMDFASAMDLVAKAAAGQTSALTRHGIVLASNVEEGQKFEAVLAQINERFGATAQAAMGDTITKTNALKQAWGDFKEQVGAGLNEGLAPILDGLTAGVGLLNKAFKAAGVMWGWTFDGIFTGIQYLKTGFIALGESALKSLSPMVKVASYVPVIGKDIKAAFDSAVESLDTMRSNSLEQARILNEMRTPLSDIFAKEQEITQEQQTRLDLQAEEINNRLSKEQEAQDQLTEIVKAGVEERKEIVNQQVQEEQAQAEQILGLKEFLGLQEVKSQKSTMASITGMLRQGSKEQMAVQKAQGIAQAAISSYQAANSAYSALAGIPIVGPALGAAAAAAALAYGLNNVAQISAVKLADGGLVKAVSGGVNTIIGEGGSDEAVLPLDNTRAMQRIGSAIGDAGGVGANVVVNINVAASGGVEAILEQLTEASRSGVVQALEFANLNYKVGQEQQGLSV